MTNEPAGPSTAAPRPEPAPTDPEPSIGQLVAAASRDVSSLIQHEIALAKAEVRVSMRNGGVAAALFGAAAFLLVLSLVMLSVAIAYLIHLTGLHLAWCFLIVWLAYTLVAAVLGYIGYRKVKSVRPPERAIEQAKETKEALTRR